MAVSVAELVIVTGPVIVTVHVHGNATLAVIESVTGSARMMLAEPCSECSRISARLPTRAWHRKESRTRIDHASGSVPVHVHVRGHDHGSGHGHVVLRSRLSSAPH